MREPFLKGEGVEGVDYNESGFSSNWLYGVPVQTAKWRIRILRVIYPRRWWVQIRGKAYLLREPVEP